jgi:arginine-tRNA-protein transferase
MLSENNTYYPERLSGEELDNFLEMGWYRMGQSIFTTHFLLLGEYSYRVFWLRYNLKNLTLSKSQQRLKSRNMQFEVAVKPLAITDEIEELYSIYKTGINFPAAPSVHYWLNGNRPPNDVFDTELIEIRNKGKLIAVGIVDRGSESIAGIMNFYHPDYKRYSLGKYLMLLKIELGLQRNFRWYYPGYIVYQRPEFDYKLFVDKSAVEVLIPEMQGWQLFQRRLIEEYGVVI